MKHVNKDKFVDVFECRAFGAKGWLQSKLLACPHCGKSGKFGVKFDEHSKGVYHCFKCDAKGSLFVLLNKINRQDLIISDRGGEYDLHDEIKEELKVQNIVDVDLSCPEIKKPLGFKSIDFDPYLDTRGWESWQYDLYHAGVTLDPSLKNKITFLLYENETLIGYLSRSKLSKEWHKRNLEKFKQGKCSLVLRYDNSKSTPFERVVGGIDEIVEGETHTVLLVEGIMDKANTDKVLKLNESAEVKCCFTFGCSLSRAQILKIKNKGVRTIVLLYDPGTIQQVKAASLTLTKEFDDIYIGELTGTKDPGEMNLEDFEKVFVSLTTPMEYFTNRVQNFELK